MADRSARTIQLDLFQPQSAEPVGPAPVEPSLVALTERLPPAIHLGTSSWSFPGWAGLVYDREVRGTTLARHGLAAYARHPLVRAVGIDRTYYAPIPAAVFATYRAAVPAHFRFLIKAHELCTLARFGRGERHAEWAGQRNARFLDAAYAAAEVIEPAREGLRTTLGPIVFQVPPQAASDLGTPARFAERLERFLCALPRGPLYAVELRNRELLTPAYGAALTAAGAVHCFNVHPTMPPIGAQQLVLAATPPATVVRWMLQGHLGYDEARAHYAPFNRLVDPDPRSRKVIAGVCREAARAGRPSFVIINNKAEGSAPRSVVALAEEIVAGF